MRRVGVIVDADIDPFSRNLAKAAGEATAFRALLHSMGKERIEVDVRMERASIRNASRDLTELTSRKHTVDVDTRKSRAEIDDLSGRVRLLADAIAIVGPALVPIGALAVPAVTGLANQLGLAAAAGGTAILAFQGVGDAVGAMNEYAVEPSAENMAKVGEQLAKLSPQAAQFAGRIGEMRSELVATRDAAAGGLFPELTPAMDDLEGLLGRVQPILAEIGSATGEMLADGLQSLNSERWQEFFDFLGREARPTLLELGATTGDFAHGLANLWQAFQPLNRDFSGWLRDVASGFDGWSAGLAQTEGFNEFIAYIRDNGPRVADALGALGGALVDIVTAAAPFGGPVLAGIEAFSKAISAIADSPAGPAIIGLASAMALLNRAMAVQSKVAAGGFFGTTSKNLDKVKTSVTGASAGFAGFRRDLASMSREYANVGKAQSTFLSAVSGTTGPAQRTGAALRDVGATAGKAALGVGALAVATTEMGDSLGVQNTASLGLAGAMISKWGGAAGAAVGGVMDLRAANEDLEASFTRMKNAGPNDQLADFQTNLRGLTEQGDLVDDFWARMINPIEQFKQLGSGEIIASTKAALSDMVGYGVSDMRDDLAEYNREAAEAANTGNLGDALSRPFEDVQGAAGNATGALVDFTNAAGRLERFLSGEAALIDYESALDDMSDSLKKNGNNFNADTRAGQENGRMMISLGQSAIEYAKTLKPKEQRNFLRDVREDLRGIEKDFPAAGRLIGGITRELDRIKPAKIKIDSSGVRIAEGQARGLRTIYDGLDDDLKIRIETQGVPQSRAEVMALKEAYDLTPDQVRTLMTLQAAGAKTGIRDVLTLLGIADGTTASPRVDANTSGADDGIRRTRDQLSAINRERATPTLNANDRPAQQRIGAAAGSIRQYAGLRPNPALNATDRASGIIGGIIGLINRVNDKSVTITTNHVETYQRVRKPGIIGGGPVVVNAEGGYYPSIPSIRTYARGGREPGDVANAHMPELARAGTIRVWREPETKGEGYVPLADDYRRPLAKGVVEDIVDEFGGQVEWDVERFAKGGRRGPSKSELRDRRAALRQGIRDFNPDPDDGVGPLKREIREFQRALKEAHRPWTRAMRDQARELVKATRQYGELNRSLDKAKAFEADVAGGFRNEIFGNGLEGLRTQLDADTNDADAMKAALKAAERLGLNGQLYKALAASKDLNTAQQLGELTPAEITALERQYAARNTATNALAATASREVYGKSVAEFTSAIKRLDKRMDRLPAAIERGAQRGSEAGSRRGANGANRDRNRRVAARTKVARR